MKQALIIAAALLSTTIYAGSTLSNTQKNEVTQLIEETLQNKPELIVKSIVNFRQQQMAKAQSAAQDLVNKHAKTVFSTKNMPILGNANGDITIIEFLDYQCHHCQDMSKTVDKLIAKDAKVRVVIRELPIFGGQSMVAAKAALAANKQGKFIAMHKALFSLQPPLTNTAIIDAAKKAGIDTNRLQKDMDSDAIDSQIQANFALAKQLNIMATPTFIIGNANSNNNIYAAGGMPITTLQHILTKLRG